VLSTTRHIRPVAGEHGDRLPAFRRIVLIAGDQAKPFHARPGLLRARDEGMHHTVLRRVIAAADKADGAAHVRDECGQRAGPVGRLDIIQIDEFDIAGRSDSCATCRA
jgi:hypothetical protein